MWVRAREVKVAQPHNILATSREAVQLCTNRLNLLFTIYLPYQLVQDVVHQDYHHTGA